MAGIADAAPTPVLLNQPLWASWEMESGNSDGSDGGEGTVYCDTIDGLMARPWPSRYISRAWRKLQ